MTGTPEAEAQPKLPGANTPRPLLNEAAPTEHGATVRCSTGVRMRHRLPVTETTDKICGYSPAHEAFVLMILMITVEQRRSLIVGDQIDLDRTERRQGAAFESRASGSMRGRIAADASLALSSVSAMRRHDNSAGSQRRTVATARGSRGRDKFCARIS